MPVFPETFTLPAPNSGTAGLAIVIYTPIAPSSMIITHISAGCTNTIALTFRPLVQAITSAGLVIWQWRLSLPGTVAGETDTVDQDVLLQWAPGEQMTVQFDRSDPNAIENLVVTGYSL